MTNANGVEMKKESSAARAAKKEYTRLLLETELDRDACIAELSLKFEADIVELAVDAVEFELDELN